MLIHFEIPLEIERELDASGLDLSREAREVYLIELYRQERITHRQLTEALGLSRQEADGVLKRHLVSPNVTTEEMQGQALALEAARPE